MFSYEITYKTCLSQPPRKKDTTKLKESTCVKQKKALSKTLKEYFDSKYHQDNIRYYESLKSDYNIPELTRKEKLEIQRSYAKKSQEFT